MYVLKVGIVAFFIANAMIVLFLMNIEVFDVKVFYPPVLVFFPSQSLSDNCSLCLVSEQIHF